MYDHVNDKITRDVLNQVKTDADSIEKALDFSMQYLKKQADVPYDMRTEHLLDARDCWLEQDDAEQTIIALRLFWLRKRND